jgi:DNA-binding CsgD family transcriptional regulator
MRHIFFVVHILAFLVGFACIAGSYIAYRRYENKAVKYYLCFLLSLTLILCELTVTSYISVNGIEIHGYRVLLNALSALGCGFAVYYTPVFTHEFLEKELSARVKKFFFVLACIPPVAVILYYILMSNSLMVGFSGLSLSVSIFYAVAITIKHLNETDSRKKKVLKSFIILTLVLTPFIFLDMRVEKIEPIASLFPYGILSFPLFYLFWNILSLFWGFKSLPELFSAKSAAIPKIMDEGNLNQFFTKFEITNREKEVIKLLLEGYSYNKISETLFVSVSTTKSHVYNIYQKTGVKNKIELLNLVQKP